MSKPANENAHTHDQPEIDPTDPQLVASMAINDVIELARAMTPADDFSRGAVEMRRRLRVMDAALAAAEQAGAVTQGPAEGETVQ